MPAPWPRGRGRRRRRHAKRRKGLRQAQPERRVGRSERGWMPAPAGRTARLPDRAMGARSCCCQARRPARASPQTTRPARIPLVSEAGAASRKAGEMGRARPQARMLPKRKRGRCCHRPRIGFRPGSCDPGRFPIGRPSEQAPTGFPIRVLSKRTSMGPFAVPSPEGSGSAGLREKWVRTWVSPPPRASFPAAPPPLLRLRSRRTSAASAVAALKSVRPFPGGRS
jgi:hypothetical protein